MVTSWNPGSFFSSERDPNFHRVVSMGTMIDMFLHNLGVPENLWAKRPTVEEVVALQTRGAGCNCPRCRARRAMKNSP